jgi:hypothetical protein
MCLKNCGHGKFLYFAEVSVTLCVAACYAVSTIV